MTPRAKKYRINAGRVEVIDSFNKFASDNVEDALSELKSLISEAQGGYAILVNERVNEKYDFFQDPNLEVFRNEDDINITYDNTIGDSKIIFNSGTNPVLKTTTFTSAHIMQSPLVETTIKFPDSEGIFKLYFNQKGNNYYYIKASWGNGVKLYRSIDGAESLIGNHTPDVFTSNSTDYTITIRKIADIIDVRVNGVLHIKKSDYILDDFGKSSVACELNTINKNLYLKTIQFGQLTVTA